MSDKELRLDVEKVRTAEDQLLKAEHSGDKSEIEAAALRLHGETFAVDLKASDRNDPAYRKQFLDALTSEDKAEGRVPLVTIVNGKLVESDKQLEQAYITQIKTAGGPASDVVKAVEVQRELMAGGDQSLFNKLIAFNHPGQDPNDKDSIIVREDVVNYLENGHPTPKEAAALHELRDNWNTLSLRLGDTNIGDGGTLISKYSMGVNLTRKMAHTLIDGGDDSVFNRIARSHSQDPETYHLTRGDLDRYIQEHPKEFDQDQLAILGADNRFNNAPSLGDIKHAGSRDWALGMIGTVDANGMHFTRDSITNGITNYGLDRYTIEPTKPWSPF